MTVHALISSSLAGDAKAWMRLLGTLWDRVDELVRASRSMGQLHGSADDRREVVSRVFARLRRNEFRALRTMGRWCERHPDKTFDDWLRIVVTNVIRSYVAVRIGGDGHKRFVSTLAEAFDGEHGGARPAITSQLAARELLASARAVLPADQLASLERWLVGTDFPDIARELGWPDAGAARAKVRAALARLRREVRDA